MDEAGSRLIALEARTPGFAVDEAARMARDIFGIDGTVTLLYGERDQNFHIRPADAPGIVLKIVGAAEDPGVIDFQTAALLHVERTDPGLPVPRLIRTREGATQGIVEGGAGARHIVRAVGFQPGRPLEGTPASLALLDETGALLARLGRALRGLFHPFAGQRIAWDPQRAAELRPHAALIEAAATRRLVERALDELIEHLPDFARLRGQIIHNDCHPGNVLVDAAGQTIVGLLDFGDLIHGSLMFDLAVPAAEFDGGGLGLVETAAAVVAGYARVTPLEAAEFPALYQAMLARHAISLTIHGWRRRHDPDGAAKLGPQSQSGVVALDRLMTEGETRVTAAFRAAIAGGGPAGASTETLIARRRRALGPGLELSYRRPVHAVRGDGVWLYDPAGGRLLDAYNNVPAVGHANPRVAAAIAGQAARISSNTRYLHPLVVEYAERLAATLPAGLGTGLFVNSGSEANDAAWRICKAASGRHGALVVANAYHGVTDAVAALSPYYGAQAQKLAPHVQALEPPDTWRGRFRGRDAARRYAEDADRAIAALEASGHGLAAFIVDSAFVSHGILDVPAGWLEAVAARVRAAGGLVIADEVQSGFGRLGETFWGFARHGIVPDLVTLGKPMANGHPVGAVVTRAEILAAFTREVEFFSTFGGNPVSAAAALATLDVLQEDGLQAHALATGRIFRAGIADLAERHPAIGQVRGSGLMIGVDLVADPATRAPAPALARRVADSMRELGVLIGVDGPFGNVLKIRPPLPFGPDHAALAVAALDKALGAG